ncbi:protein POLLENLESS 3 [Andrographis paniculata]|uniref:protein POLLENLESS 3 n=1 Tax=Andrographis paniculata TaxID=175694 RepID=UPI0021E767AC|nr:protein POLLENLESS 3 [Andrographis paniculata]XP_051124821.1 protein POLLENLESS 3 [Andrographis paniculata]
MAAISGVDRLAKEYSSQPRGFLTPPAAWKKMRRCSPPVVPATEKGPRKSNQPRGDLFHVIHKVPSGDSPYVRAKHVQLIDKDPGKAVSLFWSAINAGDRVDSALKDMAVVMKQLERSDEAIEAIRSFRHLCPPESQESLDNILVELYKQSGRVDEEIEMLKVKLKQVEEGIAFGGKRTKIARSQGKKVQISVEKEYSRLLGNLAWAYMQQKDFKSAEEHYRKALSFESDKNKQCNLAICLMNTNKMAEAKFLLQAIKVASNNGAMDESYAKSYERAAELLAELESSQQHVRKPPPVKQTESSNGYNAFCFQKYCDGSKNGVLPSPPPLPCFIKKTNNRAFTGYPNEKRPDHDWRMNHSYPLNVGQESSYSGCKKPPESCLGNRIFPKAPFTQPQCSRYGNQRKDATGHGSPCRKLSFESSMEASKAQGDDERMSSFTYNSQESSAADEQRKDLIFYDDNLKTEGIYDRVSDANAVETLSQDGKTCGGNKKSWADMVEEEEVECWRDENVDFNIITETPRAMDQAEKLSQKLEMMELGSGYFTQPEKKSTSARRSLCFDQDAAVKSHCAEQMTNNVLNFEDQALVLSEDDLSSGKSMKRRNRLQVFQDITQVH